MEEEEEESNNDEANEDENEEGSFNDAVNLFGISVLVSRTNLLLLI